MSEIHLISQLIFKNLEGSISGEEKTQLDNWITADPANRELFDELSNDDSLSAAIMEFHPDGRPKAKERIWAKVMEQAGKFKPSPVIPIYRRSFFKVAVAASIILVLGTGYYFSFFNSSKNQNDIAKVQPGKDVLAPKSNKAILILADGRSVSIDSLNNGTLAVQGDIKIEKAADGQIVYNGSANAIEYNTLFNPRGSKVQPLTLSDGTKVWLNNESSIRFPTAFTGIERKVEITGEAYFEVTKNTAFPFQVNVKGMEVEVLGTHFNINAYDDEAMKKTTLLEGAVKINMDNNHQLLSPGQQAQVNGIGEIKLIRNPDTEVTMAWKNGKFIFARNDIKSVMRQLEKWYDVKVEYKGDLTKEEFVGVISRSANISEILAMLEDTRTVNFEISGRKIIVK
jgi:ferric-dicitrate binding protein FerR (iron transport regulator)